jgi:hypothetical protein
MLKETVMKRLRDWFCGGRTRSATNRSTQRVRPTLEALEGRVTPSFFGAVSSVTDNRGNSETFDVHTDGTLWGNVNGSQFVQVQGESNVRAVSAGLDTQGLANVFVLHNDGRLTLQNTQSLVNHTAATPIANGVYRVVAEGNGKALVIDYNDFLWQFDPNNQASGALPVDMNGNPEFQGQPSQPLGPNFNLLDAHVTQATPLKQQVLFGTQDTVIALHNDGTLSSDLLQTISTPNGAGFNMVNTTIGRNIGSISSVTMPGSPNAKYLYTTTSNGHVQKDELLGTVLVTDNDYGNANGGFFWDVNVGWNSADWVALTYTAQVYRDGQLMDSGVASAYAGPGGSFYEVKQTNGTLEQWSPQAHETWVWVYKPPSLNWPGGWMKVPFFTNWTALDSNVSGS